MNKSKHNQQNSRRLQASGTNTPPPVAVPSPNPTQEYRSWQRRRMIIAASVAALLVLLAVGAFLLWPRPAQTVAPAAPPVPQVPVGVVEPAPQAAAPLGSSGIDCAAIEGLPVIEQSTCIEQKRDTDDGVVKLENTYVTATAADDVRRIFEQAFQQNGWQTHESKFDSEDLTWNYEVAQGARRVDLKVETEQNDTGTFTRIKIEEK